MPESQWEHTYVHGSRWDTEVFPRIQELGAEGWSLCGLTFVPKDTQKLGGQYVAVMKRRARTTA